MVVIVFVFCFKSNSYDLWFISFIDPDRGLGALWWLSVVYLDLLHGYYFCNSGVEIHGLRFCVLLGLYWEKLFS